MLKGMKVDWILIFAIFGAVVVAILIGGFSSVALSVVGGVIGFMIGALLGRFIPAYEWFI